MFGGDTHTPKPKKPFEPTPLRTISIDEVLTPLPELGTQEAYYKSYLWWTNPENTVTLVDIDALYRYQYGENFAYHTPTEKSNSIWYTPSLKAINAQVSVWRYQYSGEETKKTSFPYRSQRNVF